MARKPSYWIARAVNGLRKVAAGLEPFGESVWPGVRNDLFVAHQSIYVFFEALCQGLRVVDAGCGTGYGAYHLATRGASHVLGVDLDTRNIRFARARYQMPNLVFAVGDLHRLSDTVADADAIVASNSLEHLEKPEEFLRNAAQVVKGPLAVAIPPIFTEADASVHRGIRYHRANLSVSQWLSLFADNGWIVKCFAHRTRTPDLRIDFASPFRSLLSVSDFVVVESSPEDLYRNGAITAVFVLRRAPRQSD